MRTIRIILLSFALFASADEFAFYDSCADGNVESLLSSLESGNIDVNYPDENGNTPLILSAKNGHTEVVTALLDAGANIELAAEYPAQVSFANISTLCFDFQCH
jgi:ankyrin repeat protein